MLLRRLSRSFRFGIMLRDRTSGNPPGRAHPMHLSHFMDMAGEDWEIRRNGEVVSTVQGIRDKKKNKVDFLPGTDVQEGDEVCGAISKQTFRISRTDTNIAHGEVFAVEAYFNERTKAAASGATSHAIHIRNMNNSVIQQNSPGAKASIRVIGAAEKQSVSTILEKLL